MKRSSKDNTGESRRKYSAEVNSSTFRASLEGGEERNGIIGCEGFFVNACKVRIQGGVEIAER